MNQRRYVILTPFAQADVVAGVLRLRGFDAAVIPTKSGTVVAKDLPVPTFDDWDISELLGPDSHGADASSSADSDLSAAPDSSADSDSSAVQDESDAVPSNDPDLVAATLSKLSKYGVVLLLTELGEDVGLEAGVSGLVQAHRVLNGKRTEELSAGMILNSVDDVVEDLLLGKDLSEVKGVIEREDVTPSFLERFFGRGRRSTDSGVPKAPETGDSADGAGSQHEHDPESESDEETM